MVWVARALVELHGGSISALSDGEGLGSKFRVTLPLLVTGASEPLPPAPGFDEPGLPVAMNPRKILLVDDNVDAADAMAHLLRASGHQVLVAYGPLEALAAGMGFAPDVALLDIGLPVMDGYQLAQELRQRLGAGAPVMIALSGYGQERDRERSAEHGFAAHLVKPTTLAELLVRVQDAGAPEVQNLAP